MQGFRRMAVFWLSLLFSICLSAQNRAAYFTTGSNSAAIEHSNTKTTAQAIPFEKAGNLLLVKAELDGNEGIFILDTGAPTLVVNQQSAQQEIKAKGITGQLSASDTFIKNFRWNNAEWKNLSGLSVDMRHFNDVSKNGVRGLIGYEILKDYEVIVDPSAQTITLVSNRKELPYDPNTALASLSMQQQDHMPVIELLINGKKILLGIDTGAEINFLDQGLFEKGQITDFEELGTGIVKGLGGNSEKRERKVRVKNTQAGGINLADQTFTISDLSKLFPSNGEDLQVQGIVGNAFLNQFRYSINYRKGIFIILDKIK
jgi:Aspartyl protease